MKSIIRFIKINKLSVLLLIGLFFVLMYCHFNTMILNDDLPYSLYFRVNNRITDIVGVLKNQYSDYFHLNARVFLHFIVQFLLIYDKNLWSVLNPLVIVFSIGVMAFFIKKITKVNLKNIYYIVFATTGYFLLYRFKYLIYWVAGSVNYVWVFFVLMLVFVYYFQFGLLKYKKITCMICLFVSILCEVSAIFMIGLVISDYVIQILFKKENKGIIKYYIIFLVLSVLGFSFILFAPSTLNRLSGDKAWESLSFIDKLLLTLPVISSNMFKTYMYNLYPFIYSCSLVYYFCNKNVKKGIIFALLLVSLYVLCYICGGLTWFVLSLMLFFVQSFIFIYKKDYKLLVLLVSSYLVAYSLCITNEYSYGRVNFHFLLFNYIFSLYNFLIIGKKQIKILKVFFVITASVLVIMEIHIYTYIGQVKKERLKSIESVQRGDTNVLETKLIKKNYDSFHVDANSPIDKKYWAYEPFKDYYKLPDDIEIKAVK